MEDYEEHLEEARIYLETAQKLVDENPEQWNPAVVNSIMAMVKTIDAAYLNHKGYRPKGGGRGH